MWRLTISQTTKKSYLKDGQEVTYDSTENVGFESEQIELLLIAVSRFEPLGAIGQTKYTIEKVGEK